MKAQKVFKTAQNTILIVTVSTDGCGGRNYVSVTANEIQPILRSEAVERCREYLGDGELWKMAVAAGDTEMGLEDWAEWVMEQDGELSMFDNSLYPVEIEIGGEDYIFASMSCGCLHDEIQAVTDEFNPIMALHLSDNKKAIKMAETKIMQMQGEDTDIDFWVEKFTCEILGIDY